ncbi:MAG: translation initiation factor IF-2 [Candidatus Gastranaerophilales bacterium]|nr:translation initiation factor IF-2 [Candidatus Gastranaerophilales bacterium]
MTDKRVYEVAKELGISNKQVIECLEQKLGIKGKSHSSTLSATQITNLKEMLHPSKSAADKKPKAFIVKKAKPAAKPEVQKVEIEEKKEEKTQNIEPDKKTIISHDGPQVKPDTSSVTYTKTQKTPDIRSLLEYNNRNSLKRREAEQQAQKERKLEKEKMEAAAKARAERQNRPSQGGRPYPNNNRRFDKSRNPNNNVPQAGQAPRGPKPTGDNAQKKTEPYKPVKRHIIPQDIYDSKPGAKRKIVKGKEKQYKSKEEQQELISLEKATQKHKKKHKHEEEAKEALTKVVINQVLTVGELADKIDKSPAEIVKFLMMEGVLATVNQVIDAKTQKKVCENFELEVLEEDLDAYIEKELQKEEKEKALKEIDEKLLKSRAPVISIMGHVDHGKTTLLDSIRASKHKIVSTEVGGITQSIGAYTVFLNNKKIVFIDTPGHEAFTEMRARGAKSTDIAILVVAADDGIMPQTIEAINHARAAEIPIIVAVNKIDKPGANPDKILQQLTEHGLVPEEWGGDTVCVKVSALQGTGIDELLEYILLVAEMQGLKAIPSAKASGVVIEANLDKGKGPVATLLVQNGTLKTGDCLVVGTVFGKVRALLSDSGERVKKAAPSTPVEVLGLTEVPQAGDNFQAVENEKEMRAIANERKEKERNTRLEAMMPAHVRNEVVGEEDSEIKKLNLIIKANTNGAAEAVSQAVSQLESKEIVTKLIHVGVGDISEADVMLASASEALILGFGVKEDLNAQLAAEKEKVVIKKYEIIYQILEDLEQTMLSLLQPEIKEVELGRAEVRQIFTVGKTSKIAGCYVLEGKIIRNKTAVLLRDGVEVFRGQIDQLKRFKDDAKEVAQGFECGVSFAKFNDIREGDIIEVSTTEEVERQVLV